MIASGDWWELGDNGTLSVFIVGDMPDYSWSNSNPPPWYSYRQSITSITISDSVTSIGEWAFHECENLISATIGSGVTSIGYYAFYACGSITSIAIPNSVTGRIDEGTFRECSSLASVTIGSGVTSIVGGAFTDCYLLTAIEVDSQNQTYASAGGVLFNKNMTTLIYCPQGKTGAYAIPDGVTSIGEYAFSYCDALTSVTIPDSVTSIGYGAFYDCSNLTSVTIQDSLTTIGEYAFYTPNLTDVYYTGTPAQWNAIDIEGWNDNLTSATIHYDYVPPLSSIAVTTPPTKIVYLAGETFNTSGMTVTATYADNSTGNVTSYITVSPSGSLTTSDSVITISYTESGVTATASVAVTVRRTPDLKLIFNGVDFSDRLSTYRVSYETNFRKVVTALNGTEYFGNGTRRPIITFTLFPMTDAQAKAVYDALKVMVSSCTYTDKATNTDRTAKFRVTSSLEYVFGLRSVDGNRYYKGGEIVLRGVTCLA